MAKRLTARKVPRRNASSGSAFVPTSRTLRVALPGGGDMLIEATDTGHALESPLSPALPDFSDVADTIVSLSSALGSAMEKARPSKATVEFGVEVALDSGKLTALLVKGSAKASFKVSLTWEQPPPKPGP
jgi:hypothetical protein